MKRVINSKFVLLLFSYSKLSPGAYISKNSTHYYLPDWAYLRQKSGQKTMKDWSDHKIKAIFELSTLENPYKDSLFGLIYEFHHFECFYLFGVICLIDYLLIFCESWVGAISSFYDELTKHKYT